MQIEDRMQAHSPFTNIVIATSLAEHSQNLYFRLGRDLIMILRDFLPAPELREFVQCYRIVHFEFDETSEVPVKAYPPKPEVCLHFILRGNIETESADRITKESLFPITLAGQQTTIIYRYNSSSLLNLQIVFQPTAVFRLTGMSAFEFTNKRFDAEYFFPNIRFVLEELQEAKNYSELLSIANKFATSIVSHARKETHQLDAAANSMIKRSGNISLDWLAKESCFCPKQFERKFYERVGVNPKTYARLIRFNKAFNVKNANPDWDWLRIAIECNYFDYQHLVRDYKSFTGLNPGNFHVLESNSPECKLGLDKQLYRDRFRAAGLAL
jgi:AraC-like DNA-binding protein